MPKNKMAGAACAQRVEQRKVHQLQTLARRGTKARRQKKAR
nr:hypothetical protein [Asaia bogorensis]